MTEPTSPGLSGASNRHRPQEAAPAHARGALIALAVAAVGAVAFVVGLREALHRAPPERPAAAADSAAADSARRSRRPQLRAPEENQPDAYPRLR